jgi:hypothetical protein
MLAYFLAEGYSSDDNYRNLRIAGVRVDIEPETSEYEVEWFTLNHGFRSTGLQCSRDRVPHTFV